MAFGVTIPELRIKKRTENFRSDVNIHSGGAGNIAGTMVGRGQ